MAGYMEADTARLQEIAGRLDPAPATAARDAAVEAKAAALVCGDPMPGCQAFSEAVGRVADELIAFLTDASTGVPAYASVVRQSAGIYHEANASAEGFMQEVRDGRS